jgi:hypothetical protein
MIHNHWLSITRDDSQPLARHNSPWFTNTGSEWHNMIRYHWLSIANHGLQPLATISQWLWIMVCYAEPVGVTHVVLCWASGCDSWCVILSQSLWIIVSYAEPADVNYGVLFNASGCESLLHTMIHNHWLRITHHESQPMAQHSTTWITTTGSL